MVRTVSKGIFQSDVLIRSAIISALEDLKAKPWLLDFVFAWMPADDLTSKAEHYGVDGLEEAKSWFLNTEIAVSMNYRVDRPQLPSIIIELVDSVEDQATLGDVSAEGPREEVDAADLVIKPDPILSSFTPKSYDSTTGIVTLPSGLTTSSVFVDCILYDSKTNTGYVIEDVLDDSRFTIATGVRANFTNAFVAPASQLHIAQLESLLFRESYRVSAVVNTTSAHLLYLHSILMFALLRYKQDLLEARGYENTTLRSAEVFQMKGNSETEIVFGRAVTISGLVRQYWPKLIVPKIVGIKVAPIKIMDGGTTPDEYQQAAADQGWEMEEDQLSALRK